jgi:hypothetical protein
MILRALETYSSVARHDSAKHSLVPPVRNFDLANQM